MLSPTPHALVMNILHVTTCPTFTLGILYNYIDSTPNETELTLICRRGITGCHIPSLEWCRIGGGMYQHRSWVVFIINLLNIHFHIFDKPGFLIRTQTTGRID